jgi:two-component system cell cycle response regulator DivK
MVHVLAVDDDPDIRSLLELALGLQGHVVVTAPGGGAALEALRGEELRGHRPVVVLDVQMPDVDGWQVLEAIRADDELGDLPVILCTVRASPADLERGWGAGCDAYLAKPFDISTMGALVTDLAGTEREELRRLRAERS